MRPVLLPTSHAVLPPRLCGPVELYVSTWASANYSQDWTRFFDKRDKATHRFVIADARGKLELTVPISKPASSRCRWDEIEVSTHGAWWDVHRVALESAYGRTPYFEFYIDRFLPMLTVGVTERYPLLRDLAEAWDAQIADILGLDRRDSGRVPADKRLLTVGDRPIDDMRHYYDMHPYYQVRADRLGFIPGLSILDLIFNLGPESQTYLNDLAKYLIPKIHNVDIIDNDSEDNSLHVV